MEKWRRTPKARGLKREGTCPRTRPCPGSVAAVPGGCTARRSPPLGLPVPPRLSGILRDVVRLFPGRLGAVRRGVVLEPTVPSGVVVSAFGPLTHPFAYQALAAVCALSRGGGRPSGVFWSCPRGGPGWCRVAAPPTPPPGCRAARGSGALKGLRPAASRVCFCATRRSGWGGLVGFLRLCI